MGIERRSRGATPTPLKYTEKKRQLTCMYAISRRSFNLIASQTSVLSAPCLDPKICPSSIHQFRHLRARE